MVFGETAIIALSATCVSAADMTPAQPACCAEMMHDCGAASVEQSCCPPDAVRVDAFTAVKVDGVAFRVAMPAVVLPPLEPTACLRPAIRTARSIAATPPGPPTYLFISTFRI